MKWSLLLFGLVAVAGTAAACEGLSPGDRFTSDSGSCTLGFLLVAPDGLYFSTAGHCIREGETVRNPDVGAFGVGAFRFLEPDTGSPSDGAPGDDFGLIRVDEDKHASLNPKICGWNGPVGVYTETPGSGGVKHWGHGMVFGDLGPTGQKREGLQLRNDGDAFYWTGAGVPGDSGSAVIADDGRALGVLTHLQLGLTRETNGGTHLERGLRLAADAGFRDLRLVLMGEDPVALLAQLRAAPPADPATSTPPAENGTAPRPRAPPASEAPPA
ncbi:MAG TPA: hypothetical protein VM582_01315, partial [Candidatus Thermoplasmatota archaeon]|nr:hypothetical protein [Candidatus Thermoplasmatota archaeon]